MLAQLPPGGGGTTNPGWRDFALLLIEAGFSLFTTIAQGVLALIPPLLQLLVNLIGASLQQ